ncbi:MAG: carboxypeptidase regulatory-like domain-containing protein [Planctomycetes bacterium]|nr:carboxypeptidase regulatory-like domain-containing protein [Planctomycetota bacterium]
MAVFRATPGKKETNETRLNKDCPLAGANSRKDGYYTLDFEIDDEGLTEVLWLSVEAAGFGVHEATLALDNPLLKELRLRDIILCEAHPLHGRVLDHCGKPVPGLRVRLGGNHSPYHPFPAVAGMSFKQREMDRDGRFCFPLANRGNPVLLDIVDEQGCTLYEEFRVPWEGERELHLPCFGCVHGRVMDKETGVPIVGATIRCEENRSLRLHRMHYSAKTDAHGKFCLSAVMPSEYDFLMAGQHGYGKITGVRVHEGEEVTVTMEARQGLKFEGDVFFKETGKPAGKIRIEASWRGFHSLNFESETDENGRFVLEGLPPAEYEIRFGGTWLGPSEKVDLRDGVPERPVRFELDGYSLRNEMHGVVLDSQGHPAPRAWVSVQEFPLVFSAADEQGRFEVVSVGRPNKERPLSVLALSSDASSCGSTLVELGQSHEKPSRNAEGEENELKLIQIRLDRPLRKVRGRVIDPRGRPIPFVPITARIVTDGHKYSPIQCLHLAALANEDGHFELDPVDPEQGYLVDCDAGGYASGVG